MDLAKAKENEEMESDYMTFQEKLEDSYNEGREQGVREGREQGVREGERSIIEKLLSLEIISEEQAEKLYASVESEK